VLAIEESGDAESVVADATDGAPWQEVVVIVCHALPPVMLIAAWTLVGSVWAALRRKQISDGGTA